MRGFHPATRTPPRMLGPVLRDLDIGVLRAMRTRGHHPAVERGMQALGAGGEWGAIWAGIGLPAAAVDPARRGRWLTAAAVGPVAIGLNYAVKLAVRRTRP